MIASGAGRASGVGSSRKAAL